MCGKMLTVVERDYVRARCQELLLKGYNGPAIQKEINDVRASKNLKKLGKATIFKYIKQVKQEGSRYYLDLMKDHTAYIILHRQKLLALELYRNMIFEKIKIQGGLENISDAAVNRYVTTLTTITVSESRLEKEIPQLFNIQQNVAQTPEQIKQLESEIVANLPADLREQFLKDEQRKKEEHEKLLEEHPEAQEIDLTQYPKDTYVV